MMQPPCKFSYVGIITGRSKKKGDTSIITKVLLRWYQPGWLLYAGLLGWPGCFDTFDKHLQRALG